MRVLFVDDCVGITDAMSLFFTINGHDFHKAYNGLDAITIFFNESQKKKFDIVILDILLPDTTGITVAQKLIELDKDVKIIGITGLNDFSLASYLDYGFKDVLIKPFKYNELDEKVMKLMGTEQNAG